MVGRPPAWRPADLVHNHTPGDWRRPTIPLVGLVILGPDLFAHPGTSTATGAGFKTVMVLSSESRIHTNERFLSHRVDG